MYTAPSVVGITFALGGAVQQQLPNFYLCTQDEANFMQTIFGGTLVNAAATDHPLLGMTFVGINEKSPAQPWVLINGSSFDFVGPRVEQMGGIDAKGTWSGIGTGNPKWTPAPPPPPPPAPAPASSAGDAATMLSVLTGGASDSPAAVGTPADSAILARIESKLDAIIAWQRIPYQPAK